MDNLRRIPSISMTDIHIPVMKEEVIQGLAIRPGKIYIDGTIGAGGHAIEILKRGGLVLGLDQDEEILEIALQEIKRQVAESVWKKNIRLVKGNFRNIARIAQANGYSKVNGILLDLGISSYQLDTKDRGFSYRFTDAPLDLRMDRSGGDTAAQLVNRVTREELYDILSTYGEEQLALRISHAIYSARAVSPIRTVGDLVNIVSGVVLGENERFGVLSRVFQGLRIAVNDELTALKIALTGAKSLLVPGGRVVVISFHSLEDRVVKLEMKKLPWHMITKHPLRPMPEEIEKNRRSRSAKLRVAEMTHL